MPHSGSAYLVYVWHYEFSACLYIPPLFFLSIKWMTASPFLSFPSCFLLLCHVSILVMEARFLIRQMIKEPSEQATSEQDSSSLATDGSVNYLRYPPSQRDSAFHRAASSATSQHLESPSPAGSPSAFQNRLLILNQISYLSDFVLWEHKLNDQKDSLSDFSGKLNL